MKLLCAIVGVAGSVFPVDLDASQLVGDLKKAIKAEKANDFENVDADKLRLFLAKAPDGEWLSSGSDDVVKLKAGEKTAHVESLIEDSRELQGEDPLVDVLSGVILYCLARSTCWWMLRC